MRLALMLSLTLFSVCKHNPPHRSFCGLSLTHFFLCTNTDKQVSREVSLRIQQARQAKGWTQKELATKISEKPQVVNDYENGRGIPNPQILGKMERVLGVKLRGKL